MNPQSSIVPQDSNRSTGDASPARAPTPVSTAPPGKALKIAAGVAVAIAVVVGLAFFTGMVPNPWKATAAPVQPKTEAMAGVEVVPGIPHTLRVPEEVRRSLGIRAGNKETDYLANLPTKMPPLVLPGSTALDPTHLMRIRARFAPAEVVEIGKVAEDNSPDSQPPLRELRPGDQVKKGQLLAVLYSVDVASKKNDLVDALVQLKLDQEILERAEKVNGSLPDVFILSARRNVESDRNAIARAISSLKVWNIPEKDIQAVHKEADEILKRKGQRDKTVEAVWPRVEILAPDSGTIVERNVALHEMVVDNTVNLFQIAQVERLTVIANIPEDDLPILQGLDAMHRRWTVKPAGAPEKNGKLEISGLIEEIGYIIDPNQHTAIIKGTIANPGGKLRAGQFVTVTITIPPPTDVVEVPVGALIEDGQQSFVFVQPDKDKPEYSLCRVVVKQRFDKTAYVQTDHCYVRTEIADGKPLTDEEKELGMLPREPLWKGSRILVAGGLELKHALMDLESQNAKSGPE